MPRKIEVGTGTVGRRGPYLHLVGKVMRQDGIRSPRPELRPIQGQLQKIIHVKYRGPAAVHAGKVYGKIRHPAGNRRKVQRRKLPESGTVVTEHLPQHGIDGGSDLEKGAAGRERPRRQITNGIAGETRRPSPGMRPRRSVTVMWEQTVSGASPSRRIHIFATRADRITCIPYRTPCLSLKACLNCSKSPAPMCRGSDLRRPIPVAAAQTVWKSCRHPTGYHPAAFTLRRSSSADRVAGCGNKDWSATAAPPVRRGAACPNSPPTYRTHRRPCSHAHHGGSARYRRPAV